MIARLNLFWGGGLDLILPPVCPACRGATAHSQALCARCWSEIRFIEPPVCPIYGTPFEHDLGSGALSAESLADPPPFRRARAAAKYDDVARTLVHRFKYNDRPELAAFLATSMVRAGRELFPDCSLVIPVPLHNRRLWKRRFNQAAVLAAEIARATGLPWDPLVLKRVKPTPQQVGLTASQRELNVRGAFQVSPSRQESIAGRHLLLVDDVYTSGATLKAATRALLKGGAASVDVLTFARVLR